MWICLTDGFVSIVAFSGHPSNLLVRARRKKDLAAFFKNRRVSIKETPGRDYRWRAVADRCLIAMILADRLHNLAYPNFKGATEDDTLHSLYLDFWRKHHAMQCDDLRTAAPPIKRVGRHKKKA